RIVRPATPEWLEQVVRRCMAKNPADRYRTAREVVEALGQHGDTVVSGRPARGNLVKVAAFVAAAAALLLAIQLLGRGSSGIKEDRYLVLPCSVRGQAQPTV